jgi:hypothetical protein
MYAKSLGFIFAIVLAILLLPSSSFAQSSSRSGSFEDVDSSAQANGSIIVISKEETNFAGYVHTKYAFVDQKCGVIQVDHYGAPIDPNDRELREIEQRACTEIAMNTRDGD